MGTTGYHRLPKPDAATRESQGWNWGTTVPSGTSGLDSIHHEPLRLWYKLGASYSWMRPFPGSSMFVEFFEMENLTGSPLIEFPVFAHTYPCISVHFHPRGSNVMLYGVADKSWQAFMVEGEFLFGAALNAGAVNALLGVPASELANYLVNLEDLWPHRFQELIDGVGGADDFANRVKMFEDFFQRFKTEPLQEMPLVTYAVDRLYSNPNLSVNQLAVECCISRRQLSRLFRQHVGTPPKTVARLFRLEQLRLALQSFPDDHRLNLADLGYQFGYCDQAHFTKDFKDCTGVTPGIYRSTGAAPKEIPQNDLLKT